MREYTPITESLKQRIEILLTEAVNEAEPEHIDLFIIKTTNQLMELFYLENKYGKRLS
jgi:hypothetical protein